MSLSLPVTVPHNLYAGCPVSCYTCPLGGFSPQQCWLLLSRALLRPSWGSATSHPRDPISSCFSLSITSHPVLYPSSHLSAPCPSVKPRTHLHPCSCQAPNSRPHHLSDTGSIPSSPPLPSPGPPLHLRAHHRLLSGHCECCALSHLLLILLSSDHSPPQGSPSSFLTALTFPAQPRCCSSIIVYNHTAVLHPFPSVPSVSAPSASP